MLPYFWPTRTVFGHEKSLLPLIGVALWMVWNLDEEHSWTTGPCNEVKV